MPYVPEEGINIYLHSAQLAVKLLVAALARPPDDAERFDVETRLREFRAFVQMRQLKKQYCSH